MTAIARPPHTPRQRLAWVTRYSEPKAMEPRAPRYLIAPALLAVLLLIIVLAIAIGTGATEFFQVYTQWLKTLASPGLGPPPDL